jgi:hypothetical protein
MKITTLAAAAFSLALLAACDRSEQRPPASPSSGSTAAPQPTPTAPHTSSANDGKSERVPPVQGREDTRQVEQTRDFKHPDTGGK